MHDTWFIIILSQHPSHSVRPRALRLFGLWLCGFCSFFFLQVTKKLRTFFLYPHFPFPNQTPSGPLCMFSFFFSIYPLSTYHYLTIPLHPLLPSFFSFLFHFILSPTLYSTPTLHYSLHFTTFTTFRMTFFYFSNTHLNFYFFFLLLHHCRSLLSPSKYILSIHN